MGKLHVEDEETVIVSFVRCTHCGRSKKYQVDSPDDHSSYKQEDLYQMCPECVNARKDTPETKLLDAMFGTPVPEDSLW